MLAHAFLGRAQEKTQLFRTEKRRDREGKSYPWIVKTTGVVNHFYFYCADSDFGPLSQARAAVHGWDNPSRASV